MSVLIKGMKMPKSCCSCRFVQKGSQEFCGLLLPDFKYSENWARRPSFCPLIPVPPHGRLIDADALTNNILLRTYIRFHTGETPPSEWMILGQHIINAPTILEAEVEE